MKGLWANAKGQRAWLIYGQHGIKLIIYACPELGPGWPSVLSVQQKNKTRRSKTLATAASASAPPPSTDEASLPSVVL